MELGGGGGFAGKTCRGEEGRKCEVPPPSLWPPDLGLPGFQFRKSLSCAVLKGAGLRGRTPLCNFLWVFRTNLVFQHSQIRRKRSCSQSDGGKEASARISAGRLRDILPPKLSSFGLLFTVPDPKVKGMERFGHFLRGRWLEGRCNIRVYVPVCSCVHPSNPPPASPD